MSIIVVEDCDICMLPQVAAINAAYIHKYNMQSGDVIKIISNNMKGTLNYEKS